jgi:DNA-directed RNA polymerase I, II, and III subunit RPABC1
MTEKDNILTSFNILHEMFKDRKYDLSIMNTYSDNEIQMIMDESGYDKGSNGSIFQIMMNKNMKLIYHMKSKYMKGELQKFLNSIDEEEDINHIIFVFKEKINSNNEKNIKSLIAQYNDKTSKHVKVEMFEIRNLLFNITKHSYVPKHVLLSTTEAEEVYDKYSIKNKTQLPIIYKTDPVAKYFDFKSGELIKITRGSTAIGESITYRYCV